MKLSLLQNKVFLIQDKYADMLSVLLPKLKSTYAAEALDEINIFWLRNIDTVRLYLKTMFPGENSYVFTAATYMNIDDMEHLPFLLMGEKHALDDPLGRYSEICNRMPEGEDLEGFYNQIGITAEDNLKVLKKLKNQILILPLRLLNQPKSDDSLFEMGEHAFISLFNGINSLSDYFEKCKSIEDIIKYSRDDIGKIILFSVNDDPRTPFEKRFETALSEAKYIVKSDMPDSYNYFVLVYGFIQQAIDVIMSCVEYECVPYVRNSVVYHYISLLSESIEEVEHIATLRYRMSVALVVYQHCDDEKLAAVPIDVFLDKNQEYQFANKLFSSLSKKGINKNNFLNYRIQELVVSELDKFYDWLLS